MSHKGCAIYLRSNSHIRQAVCDNEIARLKRHALSLGYDEPQIFVDHLAPDRIGASLNNLLDKATEFSPIVIKNYSHLDKYTAKALEKVLYLKNNGALIYPSTGISFSVSSIIPTYESPKVATYNCHWGAENENIRALKDEILLLYARLKLNSNDVDQYNDESPKGHAGHQPQLKDLINNKSKYDLIIIHNSSAIHWRTYNFCQYLKELDTDIISLQEGFFQIKEVANDIRRNNPRQS